jgi:hypothetical protein
MKSRLPWCQSTETFKWSLQSYSTSVRRYIFWTVQYLYCMLYNIQLSTCKKFALCTFLLQHLYCVLFYRSWCVSTYIQKYRYTITLENTVQQYLSYFSVRYIIYIHANESPLRNLNAMMFWWNARFCRRNFFSSFHFRTDEYMRGPTKKIKSQFFRRNYHTVNTKDWSFFKDFLAQLITWVSYCS